MQKKAKYGMNFGNQHHLYSNTSKDLSEKDYYPFGMVMTGRSFSSNSYRYGFNSGSEKDDEITGVTGAHYTTDWRELDTRLGGRWWSPDRIVKSWESPYAGFANNPIYFTDPLGLNPTDDKKPQGNTENTTGEWETKNEDGSYTGKPAEAFELPEIEVKPDGGGGSGSNTSDVAKGGAANKAVNRYQFFESTSQGQSSVFGIKDMKQGRPGKGDWIFRVDKPHQGANYPHTNLNKKYTGFKDPHTPISNTTLKGAEYAGKGMKIINKVATPVAVVVDAKRIYDAVEQSQGQVMSKTVVVTASDVAGGWAGGFIGAAAGAKGGAFAGAAIGVWFGGVGAVPGAAIGGFFGGLAGGIGGALGGSWLGGKAAETYYNE